MVDTLKEPRYWKISPGRDAWQWDEWREEGYIAIGWDELGDLAGASEEEFENRRDELIEQHDDWTVNALNQVWTFRSIEPGDRVLANRGTSEVLGIGTVTKEYYYEGGTTLAHRMPVRWDDVRTRRINEQGWQRAIIELDQEKFEEIAGEPFSSGSYFSPRTFELLSGLHQNPHKDFYLENKDDFKTYVEEPFQQLMKDVAARLPADITDVMETERKLFSRILKNDFGKGGAWDFYWGAFYPRGGKRTEDAQLSLWINHERLEFGFYIGDYGKETRARFLRNCQENLDRLSDLLQDALEGEEIFFGDHHSISVSPEGSVIPGKNLTWQEWLDSPDQGDFDVSFVYPKEKVLSLSGDELVAEITQAYERLFPLVLLAVESRPLPAIEDYLDITEPVDYELHPGYSLETCAQETGFDLPLLKRWVRAIERKKQAIFYGPPGTGKTYVAEKLARHIVGGGDGLFEIVQFHPAYAYEDFIQGIRPASEDGVLEYPMVPGRFLEFCQEARKRTGRSVLIIDEINRANLARVFGELMYLLEYRDREVPLAGGGYLRIPHNVRILGTMNTADRSIALVDHALRRRFAFLALYPNYSILERYHADPNPGISIRGLIETLKGLNQTINNPHYEVGVSFFLQEELAAQIADIWQMEIEPYLEEYFFDQPEKVNEFRWEKVSSRIAT